MPLTRTSVTAQLLQKPLAETNQNHFFYETGYTAISQSFCFTHSLAYATLKSCNFSPEQHIKNQQTCILIASSSSLHWLAFLNTTISSSILHFLSFRNLDQAPLIQALTTHPLFRSLLVPFWEGRNRPSFASLFQ